MFLLWIVLALLAAALCATVPLKARLFPHKTRPFGLRIILTTIGLVYVYVVSIILAAITLNHQDNHDTSTFWSSLVISMAAGLTGVELLY